MKGLPRSLARSVQSAVQVQAVRVKDLPIAVVDGIPGHGTAVIGGLPQGNILFLGAVSYLQFTTADVDVIAAFTGDYALGTVATADGNVTDAGEADLIPSTAIAAATAKVSPITRGASTDALGGGIIDNTAGTLNINLNLLIADASISGAAAFTATGVVHLAYAVLGDD